LTFEVATAPHGRYVRSLAGADFSLQANTDELPQAGVFYVLQGSTILFESEDFEPANARYKELCSVFWSERLSSSDPAAQMASAWGLLGQDINHGAAGKYIAQYGSPADLKRLQNLRNRARHTKGGVAWRRSTK
jgi:hypothetical protein